MNNADSRTCAMASVLASALPPPDTPIVPAALEAAEANARSTAVDWVSTSSPWQALAAAEA